MAALLPLIEEIKAPPDPPSLFEALRYDPGGFLLESALFHPRWGRYSFLGTNPFLIFQSRGYQVSLSYGDGRKEVYTHNNPFAFLRSLLQRYRLPPRESPLPFNGGAVGYFAYDLGRYIERLPSLAKNDLPLPECYLAFYNTVVGIDHAQKRVYIAATGLPEEDAGRARQRALGDLKEMASRLTRARATRIIPAVNKNIKQIKSNFTKDGYCRVIERALEYIAAGDIYQVNLSQRLETTLEFSPWQLYLRLRQINPAPFAAFLPLPGGAIVSASPERFLRLSGLQVETRPIKGTRPRGSSPEEDRCLRQELWTSPKDRAELVMIVDLERNDLGRVCETGSVKVPELFTLEEYTTVFHLVSTIVGKLRPDKDILDLLQATFPGGSVTGAPKVRAMEIIEELEPVRRSVYTGAIGYLGFDGEADLNIVIRSFLISGRRAFFQVGGGIVADSIPELEYEETLHKAMALIEAVRRSKGGMPEND